MNNGKNLDAAAYEKYIYKDEKLPWIKKKIDRSDKVDYWPKIMVGSINWLPFLDIVDFTADRIENDKKSFTIIVGRFYNV